MAVIPVLDSLLQFCKVKINLAVSATFMFCKVLPFPEYIALYTYESPEPGDLTFREGDVILVSKREGEWWNGSIGDRTGLFPGNYVKPKETDVRTLNT